jgi:hypothetical protein
MACLQKLSSATLRIDAQRKSPCEKATRILASQRVRVLLRHPEGHITNEYPLGRCHFDLAGGCTSRHDGFEFGAGDDGERCWRAIEGSLRRADQIVSQNIDDGPGLAEAGIGLHERSQTYRQPENRATADPATAGSEAALMRGPVEAAICALQ